LQDKLSCIIEIYRNRIWNLGRDDQSLIVAKKIAAKNNS